jgi:T5SS/PEP-CTERM-associated repeat protein
VSGTGHVITEGELIVGGGGEATMTITEEGLVETFARVGVPAIVGFGSNSDGFATIDGIDAQWTVTDALVVGQLGTGEINIVSGGTLFVEYTDFEHEPYLNIGDDAGSTGTVSVSNEFSFLDASMITTKIGADAGSEGRLEITDQGSAFLQRTTIGSGGSGEVVLNTGGSLITGTAVLGELVNSTGTVTLGSNASWEVLGQLYVGSEGTGEFYVGDTTTVTVGEFISLGEAPNSYGLMTIDGPSATVNGDFNAVYIGFQGQGEVFLTNQASWTANADVTMAEITDSFGGAYIDATSEWNVTGGLYVGGSATLSGGLGYVEVAGSVTAGSVIVWNDSTAVLSDGGEIAAPQVDIHGTLAGTGTIDVTTTINDGWVTPNQGDVSTGLLTFTGDYVQTTGGVLQLDIGGTIPETEFDMIEIGGDATLDGLLMVSFIDGFIPAAEDEFEIIDLAGSIGGSLFGLGEGTFVTTVGDVDILISFQGGDGNDVVLYTETSLVEDADFDGDGDVDGRDFLIWQRGFGLMDQEDNSLGDADFDGIIDGDDLLVWQNQYGTTEPLAAVVAVPEPATYVMCLLVVLAAGRRRL